MESDISKMENILDSFYVYLNFEFSYLVVSLHLFVFSSSFPCLDRSRFQIISD